LTREKAETGRKERGEVGRPAEPAKDGWIVAKAGARL